MATGKYFSHEELKCRCCGENLMRPGTIAKLDNLRVICGPLVLSSAYRCKAYNIKIGATQTHASGQAVDILCHGLLAFEILKNAAGCGFLGIGINQKGPHSKRFIHLDDLPQDPVSGVYRPTVWSYH